MINENEHPDLAQLQAVQAAALRSATRQRIYSFADFHSLLGLIADGATMLLAETSTVFIALAADPNVAPETRAAAQGFADLTADFMAVVEDLETLLPFQIKEEGKAGVMADITAGQLAVSSVLVEMAEAQAASESGG